MFQYAKPLKVSSPDGDRIYANILSSGKDVRIEVAYLEVVKKDDPPFAHNGVITFMTTREKYQQTIIALTKYIETLFLKGMANEDIYTSLGAEPPVRRTKKIDTERKTGGTSGKGNTSGLHLGTRGNKSSESAGTREPGTEVAESDNKSPDESD